MELIENLLLKFKDKTGDDYNLYKNHVQRVYLNCLMIDNKKSNEDKYAIAAVFHDIGIWTNKTFDYIKPSEEQAGLYLTEVNKTEWIEEVTLMIQWHHKLGKYYGSHESIVENFRKADWIDVTSGLMNFGFDKIKIEATKKRFPSLGFHRFLFKEAAKNFLLHPLDPLPMFRK